MCGTTGRSKRTNTRHTQNPLAGRSHSPTAVINRGSMRLPSLSLPPPSPRLFTVVLSLIPPPHPSPPHRPTLPLPSRANNSVVGSHADETLEATILVALIPPHSHGSHPSSSPCPAAWPIPPLRLLLGATFMLAPQLSHSLPVLYSPTICGTHRRSSTHGRGRFFPLMEPRPGWTWRWRSGVGEGAWKGG